MQTNKRIPPKRRDRTSPPEASDFAFHDPNAEEKQALIRSHTEARTKHPKGNVFGMYVGVAVCVVLVLVGWAIALPKAFGVGGSPDAAIEAIKENGAALTQSLSRGDSLDTGGQETADLIESMKRQSENAITE
jgi:hypothetical protein